mgnify:CR=1 FL=1|tara:strand:+ start:5853 stop:7070 length:1218 start_codon:yes stop_codon:yes gene_type:complete
MKDLLENFRRFSEGVSTDVRNAHDRDLLKKVLKDLGAEPAETDTAPKPEKPKRVMPRRLENILEDRGFYVNRFVDEGQYGKIWELEGRSGRRLAVKVVSVLLAGQQVDIEEKNYRWILENRADLPEEVKRHLVNVYSVDRIPGKDIVDRNEQPYQMSEGALVIIMELLAPAPKEVLGTLLMDDPDEEIPTNKIKRTFASEGAITELVTSMAKSISPHMTAAVDRWSKWHLDTLIKQVTNAFLTGENPRENMYVDYGRLSRYHAPSFKPHGPRLLNIFFDRVDKMLPDFVKQYELDKQKDPRMKEYFATRRQAVMDTTSKELDYRLFYGLKRQVVPMTYAYGPEARLGGADKYTQETFSEAEGLLNAMEHLHGERFSPRDMHSGNIMMRPDSGQLVMVDVGLFASA